MPKQNTGKSVEELEKRLKQVNRRIADLVKAANKYKTISGLPSAGSSSGGRGPYGGHISREQERAERLVKALKAARKKQG